MKTVNIAITGGSGKIGVELTRMYLDEGFSVAILDLELPPGDIAKRVLFESG